MKRIIKILITLFFIGLVIYVYLNIDAITDYLIRFFINQKEVIILDPNEYTRDYKYKRFTYEEDYYPYTSSDLENMYFNILNNGWDNFTFYCPEEYTSCNDDVKKLGENEELISAINNYVNPFNSFVYIDTSMNNYGEISLTIHNVYTDEEIITINSIIDEIILELNLNNLNDKEKIRKIYDYLIDSITYDETYQLGDYESNSTNAYGALINKKAVCSGYSDAIALFLDRFNIPNLKISSDEHIWNFIYIDGSWKHLDATWGDANTNNKKYRDKFFLISTEELLKLDEKEHNFDTMFYIESR